MNTAHSYRSLLTFLLLTTAITFAACDGSVNVTGPQLPRLPAVPPAPPSPLPTPGVFQYVDVFGTLRAEDGTCLEATVLYDGQEMGFSRVSCPQPGGCTLLELRGGSIALSAGQHTVGFRILNQSPAVVEYLVDATVVIETLKGPIETLDLGSKRVTLHTGQSVTFTFN